MRVSIEPADTEPAHRPIVLGYNFHEPLVAIEMNYASTHSVSSALYLLLHKLLVLQRALNNPLHFQRISRPVPQRRPQDLDFFDFSPLLERLLDECLVSEIIEVVDIKSSVFQPYCNLAAIESRLFCECLCGSLSAFLVCESDEGLVVRLPDKPLELNVLPLPGEINL